MGLIIEFLGFAFLLGITIKEVFGKFLEAVMLTRIFKAQEITTIQDIHSSNNIWLFLQRGTIIRLFIGGAIILLSLVLQVAGSWPCQPTPAGIHASALSQIFARRYGARKFRGEGE